MLREELGGGKRRYPVGSPEWLREQKRLADQKNRQRIQEQQRQMAPRPTGHQEPEEIPLPSGDTATRNPVDTKPVTYTPDIEDFEKEELRNIKKAAIERTWDQRYTPEPKKPRVSGPQDFIDIAQTSQINSTDLSQFTKWNKNFVDGVKIAFPGIAFTSKAMQEITGKEESQLISLGLNEVAKKIEPISDYIENDLTEFIKETVHRELPFIPVSAIGKARLGTSGGLIGVYTYADVSNANQDNNANIDVGPELSLDGHDLTFEDGSNISFNNGDTSASLSPTGTEHTTIVYEDEYITTSLAVGTSAEKAVTGALLDINIPRKVYLEYQIESKKQSDEPINSMFALGVEIDPEYVVASGLAVAVVSVLGPALSAVGIPLLQKAIEKIPEMIPAPPIVPNAY